MKCLICGKDFKILGSHIKNHNISGKDYYDKYLKKNTDGLCIVCGKNTNFWCLSMGYLKHCSVLCSQNNHKTIEKRKNTCLQKYGTEHPLQLKEVQEKYKITCIEKYGEDNVSKVKEIKEKKKITSIIHFGVDNCFKNNDIKEKIKTTNLKKYGTENSSLAPSVIQKKKETCIQKYGVDHYSKTDEYKLKIKNTCFLRYGFDNVFRLKLIKEKSKNTCLQKYGEDNFSKSKEGRQISRETTIKMIKMQSENGDPLSPFIGFQARKCLDKLQEYTSLKIIREVECIGFSIDGVIEELKLAIEFDEGGHFTDYTCNHYIDKDIERQKDLEKRGYNFFRIKKIEWDKNQNQVIEEFKKCLL